MIQTNKYEMFDLADRAYGLMYRDERVRVLEHFADLRYPSVADRFIEAVHRVIRENEARSEPS